jgi:hypothetical protein
MTLAPAANSGARFCGGLVGARKDARHSNFRYRWFQARSQSLPSLGAFGGMVLVRQPRQNASNSCVFCDFHVCGAMARANCGCEGCLLEPGDFGQGLAVCRVWAQSGLWCLHGGRAKTGRTGVLLHQVVHAHFIWAHAHFVQTLKAPPFRPSFIIPPTPFLDRNSKVLFSVVCHLKSVHSVHGVHAVCMGLPPDAAAVLLARADLSSCSGVQSRFFDQAS